MSKRDKIDWRDDLLSGIELAIVVIVGLLFYNYLDANPDVAEYLMPETIGLFALSVGFFVFLFLSVKWLNREKV